ncbi:MAG: ribonuclease III [Clostridia bacterium]|nr:ribonuclease III [Clostridia bacterium]
MINEAFEVKPANIDAYSPLTLAYVGDSIFDLILKTVIVGRGNCAANKLHKKVTKWVNAQAQAEIADRIQEHLTEEETAVYRRGRNAKSYTTAKHATVIDYRKATGLEALCGYLYLTSQMDRLMELMTIMLGDQI